MSKDGQTQNRRTKNRLMPLPPERQCVAHKTHTGERCEAAAIKGGTVCVYHGGAVHRVRDAAQRRLLEAVDPALKALVDIVTNDEEKLTPSRLAAAKDILDRAGLGAVQKIEVETPMEDEFKAYLLGMRDAFENERAK